MATTKTVTARLPLTNLSTLFFFFGLLSSAYISFLAGQHTSLLYNNILQQPTIGILNDERITNIRDNVNNSTTDLPAPHVESRLPSGQHLFIDIININSELLSSKHEQGLSCKPYIMNVLCYPIIVNINTILLYRMIRLV